MPALYVMYILNVLYVICVPYVTNALSVLNH